jgi:hypothetical protein
MAYLLVLILFGLFYKLFLSEETKKQVRLIVYVVIFALAAAGIISLFVKSNITFPQVLIVVSLIAVLLKAWQEI